VTMALAWTRATRALKVSARPVMVPAEQGDGPSARDEKDEWVVMMRAELMTN
jgi:hypothetical protein